MEKEKETLLNEWLEIEFQKTAQKAGYIENKEIEVSPNLIYRTLRFLDRETIKEQGVDTNFVISVIALIWEHIDHEEYDIRPIVIRFLARVGYSTSAIITDKNFDRDKCQFASIGSVIDEIVTSALINKNEIMIGNNNYILTDFQYAIWNSLNREKHICISAPTSAGKSFVILLNLVGRLLTDEFDIVYIVPTLSLVNQVTEDFCKITAEYNLEKVNIANTFLPEQKNGNNIYVLTQEKAIAAFVENEEPFSGKTVLVSDEIQNIERILDSSDERAKVLFDVLMEFREKENVIQTIISGPRIDKIGKIGKKIWGETVSVHFTNDSPVLNITYSVKKYKTKYFLKQYCNLTNYPIEHEITGLELICDYGKKLYSDQYLCALDKLIANIGKERQNIVFAPTSKTARKIASALNGNVTGLEKELVDYYSETVHPQYSLCDTLSKGVAYHHGKLPMHVRRTIETAIGENIITTVVCTTTLMQGMNLPAQNIIIRNPHLYLRKVSGVAELSNYEMANLRGRAGRLLKEFVGRTYVLDESEFVESDGYDQLTLFDDVQKELPTGYEEKFEEYRDDITETLCSDDPVDHSMFAYGYLVIYIRQSILKYGKAARTRMKNVGIKLSSKKVAAIIKKLEGLSVPKSVCIKNRYWDPFVLDYIYRKYNAIPPASLVERGSKARITEMMRFLRDNPVTEPIYEKYVPKNYRSGRGRSWLVNIAFQWANSTSLREMLSDERYSGDDGADQIEETIDVLQNVISYNLPLLLKPMFDMKKTENTVLASLQTGTSDEYVIKMVEMGIARETALFIREQLSSHFKNVDVTNDAIKNIIINAKEEFPYWIKVQLGFLLK